MHTNKLNVNDQWKISTNRSSSAATKYYDLASLPQAPRPALSPSIRALPNDKPYSPFSRLDRIKPKSPMIEPQTKIKYNRTWWSGLASLFTCCIPNCILATCCQKRTRLVQQAWREKITLCSIIILFCIGFGFVTFGMKFALCPHERITNAYSYSNSTDTVLTWRSDVLIFGRLYPFDIMTQFLSTYNISLSTDFEGANLSSLFQNDGCDLVSICSINNPYTSDPPVQHACIPTSHLTDFYTTDNYLEFNWHDLRLQSPRHLFVLSDTVIDIQTYLIENNPVFGKHVDKLLREAAGQDATHLFSSRNEGKDAWSCVVARYVTGVISDDTMGCIIHEIITDFFLAVVITVLLIRYGMAVLFHWWVSPRLTVPGGRSRGIFAWRSISGGNKFPKLHRPSATDSPLNTTDARHTILFVTCYSEGEESIRNTLDSLVQTTYSNEHKFLFIVADGIITGSGNNKPTSEICLDLLDLVDCKREEPAYSYEAIADGYKRINQAQVYTGYYQSIPTLLVVKCGTEKEKEGNSRPGNRGKRDSQMILMGFFQRVLFYDEFMPLDFEIFCKMKKMLEGNLTPDTFELVLMVDADTRVNPDSISHMVAAMNNDITLMGLCGETRVANKNESWVTSIQVFEYFISHHYAKAFESMFGGVTCLPGCFSMYRIKAPKNGGWIPILASPDIIQEFNVTTVNTLHAKNLLLLGEDRFLSTLMLRVFPRRQMIFVPQAKCKTVVPSSFKVLLSQRRRWINSTVHNLMELALVSDLCGIACLSMQFVVVIDLLSSIVLPAAVLLLVYFFIDLILSDSPQYQPLVILLATLGLPALLVLLTAKKVSYIGWMTIYIMALPVWNLILPIYSFWHFDDFSWGETRKIDGEQIDTRQSIISEDEDRDFGSENNQMEVERKLWHVWEKERLFNETLQIRIQTVRFPDENLVISSQKHAPINDSPQPTVSSPEQLEIKKPGILRKHRVNNDIMTHPMNQSEISHSRSPPIIFPSYHNQSISPQAVYSQNNNKISPQAIYYQQQQQQQQYNGRFLKGQQTFLDQGNSRSINRNKMEFY